jgi:hypothetical protein
MSEALRYNHNKMNWIILDGYFKDAQEAEYYCREYGVQKYTVPEKGIDGLTNWMSSMGTEKHNEFMYGCLESANRHLLQLRRGEQIDPESGKLHVGFVRLNMGMYQAYWRYKEVHKTDSERLSDILMGESTADMSNVDNFDCGYINAIPEVKSKTRYPWNEAPEWAMWGTTDANGDIYWYKNEPHHDHEEWLISSWDYEFFTNEGPCENWKKTLGARPK